LRRLIEGSVYDKSLKKQVYNYDCEKEKLLQNIGDANSISLRREDQIEKLFYLINQLIED